MSISTILNTKKVEYFKWTFHGGGANTMDLCPALYPDLQSSEVSLSAR